MKLLDLRWQDPATRTYLGSPSLARLPGGALVATHDYFGPGCPRNHEDEEHLTSVYRSDDRGRTWRNVTHISGAFWSSLFWHRGALYLLGTSQQYGSLVIRRSDDGGNTWTHPANERAGLLFPGGPRRAPPNYHCAPVPVLLSGGRLYRACEDCASGEWGCGFQAGVLSAREDADLLDARSWTMSNLLAFDPGWVRGWGALDNPGWLEGNCVEAPSGEVWNILRVNSDPLADKAAIVQVRDEGRRVSFDPADGFIDFPGGMTKFTIRRDPASGGYLALTNPNTNPALGARQRNVLALCASPDLRQWSIRAVLLADDSGLSEDDSRRLTGFQYADWLFDGPDLLYLARTAYDGAHNFHDSNRITFHILERYAATDSSPLRIPGQSARH
jgi:hypothetical protein